MKNKAIGSYLSAASAVLSLVAVFTYGSVLVRTGSVTPLVIAAIVTAAASFGIGKLVDKNWIAALLPIATPVLLTFAIGNAFVPMIDQLGFVVSGLDPVSTITGFVAFVVIALVAMIASLVACFTRFEK